MCQSGWIQSEQIGGEELRVSFLMNSCHAQFGIPVQLVNIVEKNPLHILFPLSLFYGFCQPGQYQLNSLQFRVRGIHERHIIAVLVSARIFFFEEKNGLGKGLFGGKVSGKAKPGLVEMRNKPADYSIEVAMGTTLFGLKSKCPCRLIDGFIYFTGHPIFIEEHHDGIDGLVCRMIAIRTPHR